MRCSATYQRVVGALLLAWLTSLGNADPVIYYSRNIAGSAAEADGYEYFGGYEYINYRETADLGSELEAFHYTQGDMMFCGLDAVTVDSLI